LSLAKEIVSINYEISMGDSKNIHTLPRGGMNILTPLAFGNFKMLYPHALGIPNR